jgi:small subunit ribosomal protein S20e
MADKDTKK